MPVINVGKIMKAEATARNTRRMKKTGKGYKVSEKAVKEMQSYLLALIDIKVGHAVEQAKKDGRTVILDRDIIDINSYRSD